jgi:hypothetical protein
MNVFEFGQALRRRSRFLIIAFALLIVGTLLLTFTFKDGDLTWRMGSRWQATSLMAVLPVGVTSLAATDLGPGDLGDPAALYSEMLQTAEVADYILNEYGIQMVDAPIVFPSDGAPTLRFTVTTDSSEDAVTASLAAFEWLEQQLVTDVSLANIPVPVVETPPMELSGPFESSIVIRAAGNLADADPSLFLLIDTGLSPLIAVPVSRIAGEPWVIDTSLSTGMSVLLTLEQPGSEETNFVRLTPPPAPTVVTRLPVLNLDLGANAIANTEAGPILDRTAIGLVWSEGEPVVVEEEELTRSVTVALLTPEPVPSPIGQRRGPIISGAVLIVGSLLILSIALILDAWAQERHAALAVVKDGSSEERLATGTADGRGASQSRQASKPASTRKTPAR